MVSHSISVFMDKQIGTAVWHHDGGQASLTGLSKTQVGEVSTV